MSPSETRTEAEIQWELRRGSQFQNRMVCADCHLINAEHIGNWWWGCRGRWIHVEWEQKLRQKDYIGHFLSGLFGYG